MHYSRSPITSIALLACALSLPTPAQAGSSDRNVRERDGVLSHDARAYGVKCDGATDDAEALASAYQKLSATGGGTIEVPATGARCRIGSDVLVRSNVKLRCQPGAGFKATESASFALGMLSSLQVAPVSQLAADRNDIEGCDFDLSGSNKSAAYLIGDRLRFVGNRVFGGDGGEATEHELVHFQCTGKGCLVADNTIECATTDGAKDVGLAISGGNSAGSAIMASNNQVTGCDVAAIRTGATTTVLGGAVTAAGSSAIGLELGGSRSSAIGISSEATGVGSIGVKITGSGASVSEASVVAAGATGYGFLVTGTFAKISNSAYVLDAVTEGPDGTVGIYAQGQGLRVTGVVGTVTAKDAQTHVVVGAQHVRITGSFMSGGAYGVVPSIASVTEFRDSINAHIVGNEIYGQTIANVIAWTGWEVLDCYLSWTGPGGCSVIIGEDRGVIKAGTSHARISGNRLHAGTMTPTKSICVADTAPTTCNSGDKLHQSCSADDSTQCPNAGSDCTSTPSTGYRRGNLDCCNADATTVANVVISGNEILNGSVNGIGIEIPGSSTSPSIFNVLIEGNVCALAGTGAGAGTGKCVSFPTSNIDKITGVRLNANIANAGTLYANFVPSMGTIDTGRASAMLINAASCGVGTAYMGVAGCNTTESNVTWAPSAAMTVTGITCSQPSDSTCTMGFTLRKNGADQSAVSCTSTNAAKCTDTGSVSFSGSDMLSIKVEDLAPFGCGDDIAAACIIHYQQ